MKAGRYFSSFEKQKGEGKGKGKGVGEEGEEREEITSVMISSKKLSLLPVVTIYFKNRVSLKSSASDARSES